MGGLVGGGGGGGEEPVVNVEKVEVTPPPPPPPVSTATETPIGLSPLRTVDVYQPPTTTSDYSNPIPQYQPAHTTDFGGLTAADLADYSAYIKSLNTPAQAPASGLADLYEAYYRATGRRLGE